MIKLKSKIFKPKSLERWIKNRKKLPYPIWNFVEQCKTQNRYICLVDYAMGNDYAFVQEIKPISCNPTNLSVTEMLEYQLRSMQQVLGISKGIIGPSDSIVQ